ncbi:hypothetical protein ACFO5X_11605 [Seohaeicola nanhaiensis]|uniref:DUF3828 domain-containing protein n=1 Tax=Seohaeicola nanhaiensis TaxID=1387282 RepID=A0ABV9KGZ5_9RHOB
MATRFLAMVLALCLAGPLHAQSGPEDMVRWIYRSLTGLGTDKGLAYLSAPERREQYFSGRMVDYYAAEDSYASIGQMGCIDFGLEVGAQDFDAREIDRTLTVTSEERRGRRIVTASFSNFGQLTRIAYHFADQGGFWRIDDISGDGWRVSDLACDARGAAEADRKAKAAKKGEPVAGPAYTAGAADYCYRSGLDVLRLSVAQDGGAVFDLESAQPAGHTCKAQGAAVWTGDGWVHSNAKSGGDCRLEILITSDQGLRLGDAERGCKAAYCGPTAVLEGLTFPRTSQIDCAYLPEKSR